MSMNSHTRGILIVFASFLYETMIGSFYIWGAISIYVTSYLRQYNPDISSRELMSFLPIRAIFLLFLLPYGTYMEKSYGPRM